MKTFKKIAVIMIAAMMVLGMSSMAFGSALDNGIRGYQDDTATEQSNTITILKELKVYNTDGKDIYLPTVGYTYTIIGEAVEDGTTVTDGQEDIGYVYTGNVAALSGTWSVAFGPETVSGYANDGSTTAVPIEQPVEAAKAGTSYYGGFQITVDPNTLGHAGVFRYKLSESPTDALLNAGVAHENSEKYESVRYLDVYVRRAADGDSVDTGFVVYGYVLWCPESQNEDTSISTPTSVDKTNGWVGPTGGDEYNTWNLVVTKEITGSMAEKDHQFPFQVVFTSPNSTAATIHYTATNGSPTSQATATLSSAADTIIGTLTDSSTLKLTNGGSVTFCGIPAGVTAAVQENNDTYDIYTASATVIAKTAQTYTSNQVQAGASATIITGLDNDTTVEAVGLNGDTKTEWSNDMTVISPTGLVMRFAPYALILVAGIVLLIVALKRKSRKNDDD